jgi:Lrp/AsnC family transcriptional regulator, regulator of ectoine-degradation genes
MRLDQRDLRILAVLEADGCITNQRLAERVALSPSACHDRVRRLEAAGILEGYRARLDAAAVAPVTRVHVEVTLGRHDSAAFARFEDAMLAEPQVVACDATGGGVDYLVTVLARDIADYQRLIDRLLAQGLGIERYFTYVVTKNVKRDVPTPLAHLLGR